MAGDWIKLEVATLDKPEVAQMARVLGIKHGEALELLLRFWAWIDANSVDGHVDGLVDTDVDEMMRCAGFSGVMQMIGWLKCDNENQRIEIPHADRHNGESAKKRALKNRRQSDWRGRVDARVDAATSTSPSQKASTREEKRRETPLRVVAPHGARPDTPSPAFVAFWDAYPATKRRVARKTCAEVWAKGGLDEAADQIIGHVAAMARTSQWQTGYEPAPLTYLRQRRWEDGVPEQRSRQVVL